MVDEFLSIEWNCIALGGPAHGIVTRTVYNCQNYARRWWSVHPEKLRLRLRFQRQIEINTTVDS